VSPVRVGGVGLGGVCVSAVVPTDGGSVVVVPTDGGSWVGVGAGAGGGGGGCTATVSAGASVAGAEALVLGCATDRPSGSGPRRVSPKARRATSVSPANAAARITTMARRRGRSSLDERAWSTGGGNGLAASSTGAHGV
jgi:hypothetical protein